MFESVQQQADVVMKCHGMYCSILLARRMQNCAVWLSGVTRVGDTRVKAIKSDSDSDSDEQKKGRQVLRRREKKKPGMTPQNWRLKKVRRFSGKK